MSTPKTRNVTGHEHCAACIDGWVELAGTVTTGHTIYSRGYAPCHWCELGVSRFQRHPELESSYSGSDIIPPAPPGRPTRPVKPPRIPFLRAVPDPEADDAAEIAEKQRLAQIALETASQEPISAPRADAQDISPAEIEGEEVPY